jgi:hypothetical protein
MNFNYTQTLPYKVWIACLASSSIMLVWNALFSAESILFVISLFSLFYLTYKDIKKRNE